MKSFIPRVVEDVLKHHSDLSNLVFVLPSQRARMFLKEELIQAISGATFFPQIWTIEEFIQEISQMQLIGTTQLLFEFYGVYGEALKGKKPDTFDVFSQWGSRVLHDFNEIDSYLIEKKTFFENLKDIKKLNTWFEDKKPSELAVNYLDFFHVLEALYDRLSSRLITQGRGYQGLLYRKAAEEINSYVTASTNKFVFAGFNALNQSEELLFQTLLEAQKAEVYWDIDSEILQSNNEAGVFIRKYKSDWPYYQKNEFKWIAADRKENRNIAITGAPKNITQLKYVGELLTEIEDFRQTALVLGDEKLLGLVLNALPKQISNINITMGYPLSEIPLAVLFEKLFKLYLNQQKFSNQEELLFYYKDVLNVLNDPFLNKLEGNALREVTRTIQKENTILIKQEILIKNLGMSDISAGLVSLFELSEDVQEAVSSFIQILNLLNHRVTGIEKEYVYRFYGVFQELEFLNEQYGYIQDLKTLSLFYKELLRNEQLSFRGEPLQGLQLMGLLETRALDFKNLIITSLNEGVLPGGKSDYSFIPYDVKRYFGLPTYNEKDAIYSYHFQRLLQRATNVHLLYNTETDGYGSGEKSRFLTRLELKNPEVQSKIVSPAVEKNSADPIVVVKTDDLLSKLKEVFEKGISPSALALYIDNPIRFYEQKVLKIYEDDLVEETIAANTMGSVIHDVLEQLYLPLIGKFVTVEDLNKMYPQIDSLLTQYFAKHYPKGDISQGKNKLIFEVCRNYIQRFLRMEKSLVKKHRLKIVALEQELKQELEIDGIDSKVYVRGFVDRIDELDGTLRIIDYKTGKVVAGDLRLPDFSVMKEDYKYTKALQVMLYSYMFTQNLKHPFGSVESGVISFKNLNAGFLKMNFSENPRGRDYRVTPERIDGFIEEIKHLVLEILNPEHPFVENTNSAFK